MAADANQMSYISGGEGRMTRALTRGTDNIFYESILEQAQMKKPAFNTGTFRVPN